MAYEEIPEPRMPLGWCVCIATITFMLGILLGGWGNEKLWTSYVVDSGKMEYHFDPKTGDSVLRWKE